ncbi:MULTISPECIES: glutamine synthetase III [Clostridium]|uniref:Glutamate--ammonia ligase n=4 Tax=Clostridium butyricum TaxID=1492 RepID=C4IIG8_CLOBU|nr:MULTISPECIES: glutamine synthetase III [Clostridium]AXB84678.1 glutamine synthetase type III [Clostridium butyricum]EDT73551.1 glutamine synthetase, catalytic region [Clostridium butyricum 5521]EEP54007.1 glutamate--ammonia ligase [Clostridium butyricum E4 str. BoNT E BL5262]EMU54449.1 glutamate--ammonia ligase [Clostridium butyricum DKU-01]KIU07576.1 glutamine synthetase, catalytic region [Clostridium butyricum]
MSNVNEIFGTSVFNDAVMKERLPKATYKALKKTIEEGTSLKPDVADVVASAMKDWAVEKGATHFTHWFQPMTGITAEKHDAFINPTADGKVILEFSGKELIKGEPDASSFPSGGLRATFEARGYTAWDCTSPAFIKDGSLCIPTAFCSYNGEALDKKTPLLRSMEVLNKQAMRVLRALGNTTSKKVITTVGPEQEYFLIDKKMYDARKDIILTGRTLFGAKPSKGQELEDHYFGVIKPRISAYMKDLDEELWKLGISAKTKHNEVAPGQHELAPIFSTTNIATDNNQLTMEVMKKVADKHGLYCLLHEKPFAGVNGSGKHNNWSMSTDDGMNLLEPGTSPHENKQFLLFLCAVIKAVDEYPDLLRVSAANAGNDHRLGANEAPPAIISIFLGDQLEDVLEQIEKGPATSSKSSSELTIGVNTLPNLPKDATDRNRTSPFAFTGNKFEFRMVPSSASIGCCNYVLNTIVAETLDEVAGRLEKASNVDAEIQAILTEIAKDHKRVIFNGNGYSDEWVEEAARRGLPNIKSTVEASKAMISEKNLAVLEKYGVLSRKEAEARYEIVLENYNKIINIEALTTLEIAKRQILPAAMKYASSLAESINAIKATGVQASVLVQSELLTKVSDLTVKLNENIGLLEAVVEKADNFDGDIYDLGMMYRYEVFEEMQNLRECADKLEVVVDKEFWPLPTYEDMLFNV